MTAELLRVQGRQVQVEPFPGPCPRCPGSGNHIMRKVIGGLALPAVVIERAADVHYPRVVPIAVQQLFAVTEEVGVGEAVVFHHDPFLHLAEEPGNARHRSGAAAVVDVRVVGVQVALPVDQFPDDGTDLGAFHYVVVISFPGTVAEYVEGCRLRVADGGQDPADVVGAVEGDEKDGRFHCPKYICSGVRVFPVRRR